VATVRVLSWKGIPAQVKARDAGGSRISLALPEWFAQEIDRAAMREGLTETDAYLSAWEWSDEIERPGQAAEVARAVAEELAASWGRSPRDPAEPEGGKVIE